MRSLLIAALLAAGAVPMRAQDTTIIIRPGRRAAIAASLLRQLPSDVAGEVVRLFNSEGTLRFSGRTLIPRGGGVDGNVAVLGGPVTVAGRISGALVVVNGDLTFEAGAVVSGDVLVVGGTVIGADRADVAGDLRFYRDQLRYRRAGDEIAYAPRRDLRPEWLKPLRLDHESDSRSGFRLAFGGIYNRVEGLPVIFGPDADVRIAADARLQAEARAIFRTAGDLSLETGDMGYRLRAELVLGGRRSNIGLGARSYDVISSTEPWPLRDLEAGWSTFLLHRDYRDWYRREGASVYATLRLSQQAALTAEARDERHHSVGARDPWTLLRSDDSWRANPGINDGRYRSLTASARLDTRNDRAYPTAGLLLQGEWEWSEGSDVSLCATGLACFEVTSDLLDGKLRYRRVFFDLRSYTRFSPNGRLHLRLAGGGWAGGEHLPLQRRVALGFPDPLPGYGFRQFACGGEHLPGTPGMCDRVLVGQVEFRSHSGLDIGPEWASSDWSDDDTERFEPFHVSGPDLVVFADAGRAWLVGDGAGLLPPDRLPRLSTFRADVGIGMDFGPVGFYVAKPLGHGAEDVTFSVRMGRRF